MTVPFREASYLAQVARLRSVAAEALRGFPLKPTAVRFINHGENATFRGHVRAGRNTEDKFRLRVHRADYHTPRAIDEELAVLRHLHRKGNLRVPLAVAARNGKWRVTVDSP